MAKKKLDDMTEEEINALPEEQQDILADKGEIDISDTPPADQPPPADDKPDSLPPDDTGADEGKQDTTPDEDDVPTLKQKLADLERREQELRRESEGRLRDLIDLRQKHKEAKPPEQLPADPFADLQFGDEDFVDGKSFKSALKKVQDYISTKEKDFNAAVEQRVAEIQVQQRIAVIETSRKKAETAHPDYQDTVKTFFEGLNPAESVLINQELAKSQDPAEECYQMAKRFAALRQKEGIAETFKKKPAPRVPSGGSGGGAPGKITIEQFLSMTDEQVAKIPEAELRELHKQMGET